MSAKQIGPPGADGAGAGGSRSEESKEFIPPTGGRQRETAADITFVAARMCRGISEAEARADLARLKQNRADIVAEAHAELAKLKQTCVEAAQNVDGEPAPSPISAEARRRTVGTDEKNPPAAANGGAGEGGNGDGQQPIRSTDDCQEGADAAFVAARVARGVPEEAARVELANLQRLHAAMAAETAAEDADGGLTPAPISAKELILQFPNLREPLIFGLLRRGEVMNLVASPKMLKSWLVLDLALSVASGAPWLRFDVRRGRVLLLDWELHRESIAHRLSVLMQARGADDAGDTLHVECFRGRRPAVNIHTLADYFAKVERGAYDIIIIDALYRLFSPGADENDNLQFAALYTELQSIAESQDAGIVCVHHATKGLQTDKLTTDVGSGGGSQSRAADCHIALRYHAQDDAAVMSLVTRTWPPVPPFCIRWTYPTWSIADDLDAADLRRPAPRRPAKEEKETAPESTAAARAQTPEAFAGMFVGAAPRLVEVIRAKAKSAWRLSDKRVKELLAEAETAGLIVRSLTEDRRVLYTTVDQTKARGRGRPPSRPETGDSATEG